MGFYLTDLVWVSCILFAWLNIPGTTWISICFSCTSVFRWDLFGVIGCPKCEDVNLFRKQQAIYNFCLFLAFFFKRFEVSFACGVFETRWNPPFVWACNESSNERVRYWGTCVKDFLCNCFVFGTMEMPDETQLGQTNFFKCQDFPRLYTNVATWCHSVLDASVKNVFWLPHVTDFYWSKCKNPQIITQYFDF